MERGSLGNRCSGAGVRSFGSGYKIRCLGLLVFFSFEDGGEDAWTDF